VIGLADWYAGGEQVMLTLPAESIYGLFCHLRGSGPSVTLLHGFPTCSWDWAGVVDAISPGRQLVMPDLLGYGHSEKPAGHAYSLMEQADLVEALWRHFGVAETALIVHDIGGSIAQELLARGPTARITQVTFLNAGLYHGISQPRLAQRLLAHPVIGPIAANFVNERVFVRTLTSVFADTHPLDPAAAHGYWAALQRGARPDHMHRLLSYIAERQQHHVRWETALAQTKTPLSFIWGLADPVSGRPVADVIQERLPRASFIGLDGVGHYPQLEVPEQVGQLLATSLERGSV
jgi:pimeloyl-ACP methyl ester carboxylesterase